MTGTVFLWAAVVSSLYGTYMYVRTAGNASRSVREARWGVVVSTASVFIASILLMMYIFQHRFEFNYIYSYSSRDLPGYLLATTFWAGQEGSFLLWALCGSVFGLILMSYARAQKTEPAVMAVYGLLQSFLLILLLFKSPFVMVWDAHAGEVAVGQIPPDGRGLNPLLQNMWMAIHPPMLFVGFASLAVPFALAIAALWKRSFDLWTRIAFPWVLFAVVSLGAGIMLGGYWAYGVLGWGGWWGWDPVENSSLIPWLISVTLLHTLVVQSKNGSFVKTNFILTTLAYVTVVYSTFLTRSGILGESSVHSFTDPGTFVYTLLSVWVVGLAVLSFFVIRSRWKDMRASGFVTGILRKDTMLAWAAALLLLLTAIIFVGTSWPIIANGTVEPSFYNRTALPMGILLSLLLAVSLALQWEEVPIKVAFTRLMIPGGLAVACTAVLLFMGVSGLGPVLFTLVSLAALFMSVKAFLAFTRIDTLTIGGPVAHIGVAVLFLGIIGSGFFNQQETVSLPLGEPKDVLGYQMTYAGAEDREGKWHFKVDVKKDENTYALSPVMFRNTMDNSTMRNPDYVSMLTRDVYVEPVSVEAPEGAKNEQMIHLKKGASQTIGEYTITFRKFEMQAHASEGMTTGGPMGIGVVLDIAGKKMKKVATVVSSFDQGIVSEATPYELDKNTVIRFLGMNIGSASEGTTVILSATDPNQPVEPPKSEMLVVEASVKPLISFVWLGSFLTVLGAGIAIFRRRRDLHTSIERQPVAKKVVAVEAV